jgi:hypothetical protein
MEAEGTTSHLIIKPPQLFMGLYFIITNKDLYFFVPRVHTTEY